MTENPISETRLEPTQAVESLWKHTDFLKLWSAQTVSAFGDQFTALALPLIAVILLKATAIQMGILTAVERAPFLLLSLFAGVWVDRLPRRPILMISDLGRAMILFSIPLAAFGHWLSMPQLYLVALLVGVLGVFFDISYQAILPAIVHRKQLVEGNGKLEATRSMARLAGPGLAGAAIQYVSAPAAIVVDAFSFLISGGVIGTMTEREHHRNQPSKSPMLAEIRDGLSVVFGNRLLRSLVGCTATANLFSSALFALYILFATRVLALSPAKIGLIFSLGSVSGLLGALGARRLATRFGLGRVIVAAILISGFGMIPVALATPHLALPLLVLASLLSSFGIPVYNINQISLRQAIVPNHLQGRMNATMRFISWGVMPLGSLASGALGGALGLRAGIAIAVAGGSFAFMWVLLSPVRHLRTIPEQVD
ncbi:MAG: MFS transporter [Rhizomicrobium sp.]